MFVLFALPGRLRHHICTNHAGVIYYTGSPDAVEIVGPVMEVDCSLPTEVLPIGE
jgi:hypothetical protein